MKQVMKYETRTDLPAKPFAIGLAPLGDQPWLIVDDRLSAYLAEKAALRQKHHAKVFAAGPETASAQKEAFERVLDWQLTNHPKQFSRQADTIRIAGVSEPVTLDGMCPLDTAGRLCAEDLVLMRKDQSGWRLSAATLSFPSSWSLAEKFTHTMEEVHRPVPGFADGTRNASLINRIFDNLAPNEPVLRGNWSIYGDDQLYHPDTHRGEGAKAGSAINTETLFLREERQTLTRLPASGDILFTILITLLPLSALSKTRTGQKKAGVLLSQLENMSPDQLSYKALSAWKPELVAILRQISGS